MGGLEIQSFELLDKETVQNKDTQAAREKKTLIDVFRKGLVEYDGSGREIQMKP